MTVCVCGEGGAILYCTGICNNYCFYFLDDVKKISHKECDTRHGIRGDFTHYLLSEVYPAALCQSNKEEVSLQLTSIIIIIISTLLLYIISSSPVPIQKMYRHGLFMACGELIFCSTIASYLL